MAEKIIKNMNFMSQGILNHTIKTTSRLYLSTRPKEIKSIRFMHRIFSNLGQKMITPVTSTHVLMRPYQILARNIKIEEDKYHPKISVLRCTGELNDKKCPSDYPMPKACALGKTEEECSTCDMGEFTPGHVTHTLPDSDKLEKDRTSMFLSDINMKNQSRKQFAILYSKSRDTSALSGKSKEITHLDQPIADELHSKS
jgi:hypothetical protein